LLKLEEEIEEGLLTTNRLNVEIAPVAIADANRGLRGALRRTAGRGRNQTAVDNHRFEIGVAQRNLNVLSREDRLYLKRSSGGDRRQNDLRVGVVARTNACR